MVDVAPTGQDQGGEACQTLRSTVHSGDAVQRCMCGTYQDRREGDRRMSLKAPASRHWDQMAQQDLQREAVRDM